MATIGSLVADLKLQSAAFIRDMTRASQHMSSETARMRKSLREVETSVKGVERAVGQFRGALVALGGALALGKIVQVAVQFQDLQASLRTVTGSAAAGAAAFEQIKAFASTTPFSLQQATEAFIKLKALGLDPSMAALRSYGNTASAMGKDLSQFIEAVADASTGEFERLKEFGITAKQQGDVVRLTFQGVTTQIGKNATEIQAYLRAIGEVQFATAMEERMKTLGGAISNMTDALTIFLNQIAEGGFGRAVADFSLQIAAAASGSESLARDLGTVLGAAVDVAAGAFSVLADNANLAAGALAGFIVAKTVTMIGTLAVAVWEAVRAFRMLGVVVAANPLGAIATVIGIAVAALVAFKDETFTVGKQTVTIGAIMAGVWKAITTAVIGAAEVVVNYGRMLKSIATLDFEGLKSAASDLVASARSILDAPAAGVDEMRRQMAGVAASSGLAGGALDNLGNSASNAGTAAAKASKDIEKLADATKRVRDFLDEERLTQTDAGKAAQPYIERSLALQGVMKETAKVTKGTEAYAAAQKALLDVRTARTVAEQKAVALLTKEGDLHVKGVANLRQEAMAALRGTTALDDLREMRQRHADVMAFEAELQELVRRGYDLQGRTVQDLTDDYRKWREELDRNTKILAEQERNRELLLEPFKNAIRGIQDAFSGVFRSIFDGGVDTFGDLGGKILDIMKETATQVAALLVFRPVVGSVLGGLGLGGVAQQMGLGGVAGTGGAAGGGFGLSSVSDIGKLFSLGSGGSLSPALDAWAAGALGFGQIAPTGGAAFAAGVAPVAGGLTNVGTSVAPGLLNGGSALGGFASLSNILGIGGAILPGLISGNYAQAAAGGIGAAIGTAILPGIGTALGGIFGNLVGGLFGKGSKDKVKILSGDSRQGNSVLNDTFDDNLALKSPFGFVGLANSGTTGYAAAFVSSLAKALQRTDQGVAQFLSGSEVSKVSGALLGQEGYSRIDREFDEEEFGKVIRGRLRPILEALDVNQQLVEATLSGTDAEELQQAAQELLARRQAIRDIIDYSGEEGEIRKAERTAFAQLQSAIDELAVANEDFGFSADKAAAAQKRLVEQYLGIGEIATPMTAAEKALAAMNERIQETAELAKQVGITLSPGKIEAQLREQLRAGYDEGIAAQIKAIVDPAGSALEQFEKIAHQRIEDAKLLGGNIAEVERLNGLERLKIIEQFTAQTTGKLRDWLNSQALGNLSSLSPDKQIMEARRQFDAAIAARDYDKITGTADAYLRTAQSFYASTAQYAAIERFVRGQVEGLLGAGAADAPDLMASIDRAGPAPLATTVTSPAAATTVNDSGDRATGEVQRQVTELQRIVRVLANGFQQQADQGARAETQRDDMNNRLRQIAEA